MSPDAEELERKVRELEQELQQMKAKRPPTRRVQFEFTEEAYQYLQAEAAKNHTSMADIVRDALSKKKWLDEKIENNDLLIEEGDELRRVVKL